MKKWIVGLKKSFAQFDITAPDQPAQEIDWSRIDEDRKRLANMRFKGGDKHLSGSDSTTDAGEGHSAQEWADLCEPVRGNDRQDILKRWKKDNTSNRSDQISKQLHEVVYRVPADRDLGQDNDWRFLGKSSLSESSPDSEPEQFPTDAAEAAPQEQSSSPDQINCVQSDSSRFWLSRLERQLLQHESAEDIPDKKLTLEPVQAAPTLTPVWKKPTSSQLAQAWLSQLNDRSGKEEIRPSAEPSYEYSYPSSVGETADAWHQLCDDPVYKALMELSELEATASESSATAPPPQEESMDVAPEVIPLGEAKTLGEKRRRRRSHIILKRVPAKKRKGTNPAKSGMQKRMVRLMAEANQKLKEENHDAVQTQIAFLRSRKGQPASLMMERRKRQQLS